MSVLPTERKKDNQISNIKKERKGNEKAFIVALVLPTKPCWLYGKAHYKSREKRKPL
jgi:hypothetical protein